MAGEPLKLIVGLGNPGHRVRAHASQRRLLVRGRAGARVTAATFRSEPRHRGELARVAHRRRASCGC